MQFIEFLGFIRESDVVRLYVETNSEAGIIGQPACSTPPDSGICSCESGYRGKKSNFRCEMQPLATGTYLITLKNSLGEKAAPLMSRLRTESRQVW
ncbi:MAG: hypothetical protein AABX01_01735 [Candidatus Micrarchaeota archaeon]